MIAEGGREGGERRLIDLRGFPAGKDKRQHKEMSEYDTPAVQRFHTCLRGLCSKMKKSPQFDGAISRVAHSPRPSSS